MPELRLVGADDEGGHLLLRGEDGREHTVAIDDRLRAAVRNDRVRMGQIELEMESQLRPRDMQARMRAGESAAEVALAAGVHVERVRRYEAPVLAERAHVAEAARGCAVRRHADGPGPVLGPTATSRLEQRGVDADAVSWDAWRREDGRWTVQAVWPTGDRDRSARWVFDAMRRTVVAEDDEARSLTGEEHATPEGALAFAPRRVQPVEPESGVTPADVQPAPADHEPAVLERTVAVAVGGGGSGRRASVPSWDEILFGSRRSE